jgi:hypothetical protein
MERATDPYASSRDCTDHHNGKTNCGWPGQGPKDERHAAEELGDAHHQDQGFAVREAKSDEFGHLVLMHRTERKLRERRHDEECASENPHSRDGCRSATRNSAGEQ